MSRIGLIVLFIVTTIFTNAQEIPVQFALTDTAGIELPNRSIAVRTSFTSDTLASAPEYQETQSTITNQFGIASYWIGSGITTLSSTYNNISKDWINPGSLYYIVVEVDSTGSGYQDLATIQYRFPIIAIKSSKSDTASFADTSGYALTIDPRAFNDSSAVNEIQSLEQVLSVDSNASGKTIYNLNSLTIGDTISPSAALAINRTDAGLLLPRLTKIQRNGIVNPEKGLIVYCTDCVNEGRVSIYDGNTWELLMQTTSVGQPPILITGAIENIGVSSATFNSSILDSGDTHIFASGFCWGLTAYPTISDFVSSANLINSNATLKGNVFGLDSNTTYYVRAYASNGAGTSYGPMLQFKTDGMRFIGEEYGGGYVAYLFQPGDLGYVQGEQHGIIIYPFDYPTKIPFGPTFCSGTTTVYDFPDANYYSYIIDSAKVNTNVGYAIHNHELLMQSGTCNTQLHLPAVVDTLIWNGYSDWMLPTRSDLLMIFDNAILLNSLPSSSLLTENERYLTSCPTGIYSPGSSNSSEKIWIVQFEITNSGYPSYTLSVNKTTERKWYGSAYSFRPIRYF